MRSCRSCVDCTQSIYSRTCIPNQCPAFPKYTRRLRRTEKAGREVEQCHQPGRASRGLEFKQGNKRRGTCRHFSVEQRGRVSERRRRALYIEANSHVSPTNCVCLCVCEPSLPRRDCRQCYRGDPFTYFTHTTSHVLHGCAHTFTEK